MPDCGQCGSSNTKPYKYKPPIAQSKGKAQHRCTAECTQTGTFCRRCRTVR